MTRSNTPKRCRTQKALRQSGQSALEFALIVPILLLIMLGIVAFGALFSHRLTLDNASRDACRFGVTGSADQQIANIVQDRMKLLSNVSGAMTPVSAGVYENLPARRLRVTISPAQGAAGRAIGNSLSVTVRYQDFVAVPIPGIFTNPRVLISQTVMRIEAVP